MTTKNARIRIAATGFGFLELMLIVAILSFTIASIISLTVSLKNQSSKENFSFLEVLRNSTLELIMDGRSWDRTTSRNPAPPTVLPPVPFTPFPPGTGALLDLYDSTPSNTAEAVINSTSQQSGFTLNGLKCSTFSSTTASRDCPLRYELRWFIVTPGINPIVSITATLRLSPNTLSFNPLPFSFDYQESPPGKSMNPITRQLYASWVAQGPVNSPKFADLNLQTVPSCGASFMPGSLCTTFNATCICPTSVCPAGQELYRCQ